MSFIHFILALIAIKFKGFKSWWTALVIEAFASVLFFFQVNSYGADKHHTNGLFIFLGIVFAIGAAFSLIKLITLDGYSSAQNN